MNEVEKAIYEILRFLNENHVRKDSNITDHILRYQHAKLDRGVYDDAVTTLRMKGAIAKTSPNGQWQITEIGEIELNRLQEKLDAIRKDPVASEVQDTLEELTKTHLRQQIKQGKRRRWEAVLSFVAGAILSGVLLLVQTKLQESKELKEIPIKVSVATHPPMKDTIYIGSLKDSLGIKTKK